MLFVVNPPRRPRALEPHPRFDSENPSNFANSQGDFVALGALDDGAFRVGNCRLGSRAFSGRPGLSQCDEKKNNNGYNFSARRAPCFLRSPRFCRFFFSLYLSFLFLFSFLLSFFFSDGRIEMPRGVRARARETENEKRLTGDIRVRGERSTLAQRA